MDQKIANKNFKKEKQYKRTIQNSNPKNKNSKYVGNPKKLHKRQI